MRKYERNWKIVGFWVLGSLCILVGAMMAGSLTTTVDESGYIIALLISFLLFLFGGLLWIAVAIAVRE